MKRTPLTRKTRLRRTATRRKTLDIVAREKGRWYTELRALVAAREGHVCARCPQPGSQCHHRRLRSQGGMDDGHTCVWLCATCHEWAHHNPAEATATGWIVPSWAQPDQWPVFRDGSWQQPGPSGWVPATPHERQAAA